MNEDFPPAASASTATKAMDKKICNIPPPKSLASQEGSSRGSSQLSSRDSGRNGRSNSRRKFEIPAVVQQAQFSGGAPRGGDAGGGGGGGGARRPFPVKNKNMERRTAPPPRASNSSSVATPQEREPEFGSLQSPGGRKVNVDHLLNFHLAPRQQPYRPMVPHHDGHQFNKGRELVKRRYHKQDFLQANSQFLVKSDGDYSVNFADSDLPIDWTSVEQVIVKSIGEAADCPICLQIPSAPKITKCGHMYCWHCILRYLAVTGTPTAKCPVCSELFSRSDLKSVEAAVRFDVEVGDHIDMQLMTRSKNSMKIEPAVTNKVVVDWKNIFSRIILADVCDVQRRVIEKEMRDLQKLRESDEHEVEHCFIDMALNELQERIEMMNRKPPSPPVTSSCEESEKCHDNADQSSPEDENANGGIVETNEEDFNSSASTFHPHKADQFYFYQSCDGQPIFMHPLNMAMMIRQFENNPEHWPQQISVQVIEKESHPVTTRTRDRFKVFGHLPLNSTFQLVEVDLTDIVVSKEIHDQFRNQIELRKEKRTERRKQAKRMEKLMNERLKKGEKLAHLNYPKFESIEEFPTFCIPEDNLQLPEVEKTDSACALSPTVSSQTGSQGTSFAQMASKPWMKRSPTFPVNAGPGSSKISDTRKRHGSGGGAEERVRYDSEGNEVDDKCAPDFCSTLSDAIAKAFETVSVSDFGDGVGAVGGGDSLSTAKGKKKKNKGKVVFSTCGATPFTQ